MKQDYTRNHYVPVWYQKRFISPSSRDKELFYLNLSPNSFTDNRGIVRLKKSLHRQGPKKSFFEDDLYTTILNGRRSTEVEKNFFGEIDTKGRNAVECFENFDLGLSGLHEAFQNLMPFLSTQRLRTPKGLGWLRKDSGTNDKNWILLRMQFLKNLFSAIWTESVWLIADASQSKTKFIISDHPVTTYNRDLRPLAKECKGFGDPDIRMNGTHTIYPLSAEKILILTNRSWALNPYQSPIKLRPNPIYERDAMFSLLDVQLKRHLSEQEVREINFIIKRRAFRYIAAGQEEWLYPEKYVSLGDWNKFGHGYLCMPDPRSMALTSGMVIGYKGGRSDAFDPYGRKPWQNGFSLNSLPAEADTFYNFQGEFARLFGPKRRGVTLEFGRLNREEDTPDFHQYHLNLEKHRRRS